VEHFTIEDDLLLAV